MDVVLDTVGGDTQQRSLSVLKPGGVIVSVVAYNQTAKPPALLERLTAVQH